MVLILKREPFDDLSDDEIEDESQTESDFE
jgi:hypothetical protein